jgi:hypothetical protein
VDLTVDGQTFEPGQTIACRVDVGGGGDDKLRALRVELAYENTYYHRTRDSDGSGSNETRTSDDVVVATEMVSADDPSMLGDSGTFDITLAIPQDVPPSAPKWVEWSVTAILDRRRARDRRESVAITMLGLPGGYAMWASSPQECNEDLCDMRLDVSSRAARPGEPLSGVLHVDPKREFEVRSVYVAFEGEMRHEDSIERDVGEAKVTLADATTFAPGAPQEYPFEIAPPVDAVPSFHAEHSQMRWKLKGVCDRKLRGDSTVSAEIVVYTA